MSLTTVLRWALDLYVCCVHTANIFCRVGLNFSEKLTFRVLTAYTRCMVREQQILFAACTRHVHQLFTGDVRGRPFPSVWWAEFWSIVSSWLCSGSAYIERRLFGKADSVGSCLWHAEFGTICLFSSLLIIERFNELWKCLNFPNLSWSTAVNLKNMFSFNCIYYVHNFSTSSESKAVIRLVTGLLHIRRKPSYHCSINASQLDIADFNVFDHTCVRNRSGNRDFLEFYT